jgi:hypothetical protein
MNILESILSISKSWKLEKIYPIFCNKEEPEDDIPDLEPGDYYEKQIIQNNMQGDEKK